MANGEKHAKRKSLWSGRSQLIMLISVIVGILIAGTIIGVYGASMSKNNKKTIDSLGSVYMESMGFQITQRFQSVMEQRLESVQSILDYWNERDEEEAVNGGLADSAIARDFAFLALYRVNEEYINHDTLGREYKKLLGDELFVPDKIPFRQSVIAGEMKVAVGTATDIDGNSHDNMIIISVPTNRYTMDSGKQSMSILAGVRNSRVVQMLNIQEATSGNEESAEQAAAYIIRRNQTVIITQASESEIPTPDEDAYYRNSPLKDLLAARLKDSDTDVNQIVADLKTAMENGDPYTSIMHIKNNHVHMMANKLNHTEWYLVVLMNNEDLNNIVDALSSRWTNLIIVALVVIAVLTAFIFSLYWYFNKQNMTRIEEARAEAIRANKAKSEFLSNMSHDIRTPMNAIVGMTAIARANMDNNQQVADCLKKIALSSKHLLGLINDVLDMSKIESGKMTLNLEQISLREVVDGITTIIQPQIKIKRQNFNVIVKNIEQEMVYCDSVRLNQVLLNLLSNAHKYTQEEGTLEFTIDQEKSPKGDEFVRTHIYVKDNGIGMTEEFQRRIFESFSREDSMRVHKIEGTGLGMTITKYIVDAMHGTIELKSKLGEGSEFHVTLDLKRATVGEEDMMLPDWKMLIVDDDETLCETTAASLKEIGVTAEWVLDGEGAIKKAVEAHSAGESYDIIMIDWKLPGIDGIETAKRLQKKLGENVPILLVSAYDWAEIEEEARSAGIRGFIGKPLFKSTLYYGLQEFAGDEVKESKATATAPHNKKIDLNGLKVLVAEDNELNWEIAEVLLDSVGIVCDHAENGKQAVDMLASSEPGTYKAILMDIRMPVMNGLEATVEIRKLDHPDKDLPIIAMTADAFADDMKRCLESGMNAHIAKPIDIDTVQKTLAKFVKK